MKAPREKRFAVCYIAVARINIRNFMLKDFFADGIAQCIAVVSYHYKNFDA